jgi:single-stranded-DNA-specific exonuclease RecJ
MLSRWRFRGPAQLKDAVAQLGPKQLAAANGSPLLAALLLCRGHHSPEAMQAFLNLEAATPVSGLELPDMPLALERILQALDAREPILVYGDFDVDGITGTAVLMETLTQLGAKASYFIPDRAAEGHGLHTAALIRLMSTRQSKLVITTDTGITNFNEISLLRGLRVDTIVTDHHQLPENLPPAVANVNPQRLADAQHPLRPLAGVGVAYKLCELLLAEAGPARGIDPALAARRLLDLVAIGTVADVASLLAENRLLVWQGVQQLQQRQRLGLNEILKAAGVGDDKPLTSETIGFTIGPRLNALGRLDNATDAVTLLTTSDAERARVLAARLEQLNRRRQELCDETLRQAQVALRQRGVTVGTAPTDLRAVVLASPDWHLGIIGIVASRLVDQLHVPVFLMVAEADKLRCSARSIEGFDLHAHLSTLASDFLHFGGHAGAAGFAIAQGHYDRVRDALEALALAHVDADMMRPVVDLDAQLSWEQLTPGLVDTLGHLAPFGKDNPAPLFLLQGAYIGAQRTLGQDGRHLKLMLAETARPGAPAVEALMWQGGARAPLPTGTPYDVVFYPEINTFQQQTKLQLIIEDIRPSGSAALDVASVVSKAHDGRRAGSAAGIASYGLAPVAAGPTPTALGQAAANPAREGARGAGQWIDHRGRPDPTRTVCELLLHDWQAYDAHSAGGPPPCLLFHEGSAPALPGLPRQALVNRLALAPSPTLVCWDLPPDADTLERLLAEVRPQQIHWVGGKYATISVYPNEIQWLRGLCQVLLRLQAPDEDGVHVRLSELSARLSTTVGAVLGGLALLREAGACEAQLLETEAQQVAVRFLTEGFPQAALEGLGTSLVFQSFRQSLREIGRYRSWLLNAPLAQIEAQVGHALVMAG